MGKLRHSKFQYFLQVHTAKEEQIQEVNPGYLAQKYILKHYALLLFITHFSFKKGGGEYYLPFMDNETESEKSHTICHRLYMVKPRAKPRCVIHSFSGPVNSPPLSRHTQREASSDSGVNHYSWVGSILEASFVTTMQVSKYDLDRVKNMTPTNMRATCIKDLFYLLMKEPVKWQGSFKKIQKTIKHRRKNARIRLPHHLQDWLSYKATKV